MHKYSFFHTKTEVCELDWSIGSKNKYKICANSKKQVDKKTDCWIKQ